MATIRCSVCGEENPAELEFCRNCESRLESETGALRTKAGSIQPGQVPTKKATAELEPILPQWLRDARNKARQDAEEEATQIAKEKLEQQNTRPAPAPDLLAGLQSQSSEDDEETPDWLANITGVAPTSKKAGIEEKEMRWVELGSDDESPAPPGVPASTHRITATQAPSEAAPDSPLPPWLTGIDSGESSGGRDELADFFTQASQKQESPGADQPGLAETDFSAPEAFSQPKSQAEEQETSDWLKNLQGQESQSASLETNAPSWLGSSEDTEDTSSVPPPASESPSWLKNLDAETLQPASASSSTTDADTPDWLKSFASESAPAAPEPSLESPDWLKEAQNENLASVESGTSEDIPDWLNSMGAGESAPASPAFSEQPAIESAAPSSPAFVSKEPERDTSPFFANEGLSGEDVNSLFTQMPDWLSSGSSEAKPARDVPPAAQGEGISPAELPSWVQAMRPVESSLPAAGAQSQSGDQTLETRGPLAGLQGVLPVMPFTPTSKPKAYSIKLQATQEQQAHAALLEHILETETKPEPITSVPVVTSSRLLRWAITILLLLIALGTIFGGSQVFAMPLGVPVELASAIQAVENVPDNAPVLVIFDYDSSTVGEMEAIAGPLMDHMILLRHPRLTLISALPTGPALAERFLSGPLGGHGYQSGLQYVNLGYLPGGLAGIRAFAQAPSSAAPFSIDLKPAWQSAPLQDVQSFSNFALVLLITDSAEDGRNWVEQAGSLRGSAPLVVASSAQAGPMLIPYVQSGQINGLVSGMSSGAVMEQNNAGRPGFARKYWDAYSLGLLLAVAFIILGGLWNLALGYQARASAAMDGG